MQYILSRLQHHAEGITDAPIALPNAVKDLACRMENKIPVLDFADDAKNKDLDRHIASLEKKAGQAAGTWARHNLEFWEDMRVTIFGDEPTILDDSQPFDELRIAALRPRQNITNDKDKVRQRQYEVLMQSTEQTEMAVVADGDLKGEAYTAIHTCGDKKMLLVLVGKGNRVRDVQMMSDRQVSIRLNQYAETDPKDVTDAWNNPDRSVLYTLRQAVEAGLIIVKGTYFYYADRIEDIIGRNEAEVVLWMKDPINSGDMIHINQIVGDVKA